MSRTPLGRPKADETKVFTAIRLDADLLEAFKATGPCFRRERERLSRQVVVAWLRFRRFCSIGPLALVQDD
ncbi:BrnA antitoxin family protein [Sterolibacterium denitrificans]|uniref:BrnA antitoxin family protein n=1 Tax=Sterolibacterium denitrificans TaxID=157592 RepID=UPI0018D591B2|nr:BrnA antitoxin family protein [Sterolibacterium denitrificans]